MFQALNPIEPRQTWMLRALTCLISVNPRELSAYVRMECNYFTCIVELVLPPLLLYGILTCRKISTNWRMCTKNWTAGYDSLPTTCNLPSLRFSNSVFLINGLVIFPSYSVSHVPTQSNLSDPSVGQIHTNDHSFQTQFTTGTNSLWILSWVGGRERGFTQNCCRSSGPGNGDFDFKICAAVEATNATARTAIRAAATSDKRCSY